MYSFTVLNSFFRQGLNVIFSLVSTFLSITKLTQILSLYIYYYFVSFWINICFLNENGLIIFRMVEIKK